MIYGKNQSQEPPFSRKWNYDYDWQKKSYSQPQNCDTMIDCGAIWQWTAKLWLTVSPSDCEPQKHDPKWCHLTVHHVTMTDCSAIWQWGYLHYHSGVYGPSPRRQSRECPCNNMLYFPIIFCTNKNSTILCNPFLIIANLEARLNGHVLEVLSYGIDMGKYKLGTFLPTAL